MTYTKAGWIEFIVGIFMLLGLGALLFLALQVSGLTKGASLGSYRLTARFENVGGLKERSPVVAAGVLVGRVENIGFDAKTYQAVVTMEIKPEFKIFPTDTSASIFTAGLLGEKYIGLEPGADETILGDGGKIQFTQPALVLEKIVGKFIANANKEAAH